MVTVASEHHDPYHDVSKCSSEKLPPTITEVHLTLHLSKQNALLSQLTSGYSFFARHPKLLLALRKAEPGGPFRCRMNVMEHCKLGELGELGELGKLGKLGKDQVNKARQLA